MEYTKPCTRCLLEASGEKDLAKLVKERISLIPEEEKTDDALYRQRLKACLDCGELYGGVCAKCGCYVELRAARKHGYCPNVNSKW